MKTWISWTVGTGLAVALFAIAGVAQDDSPAPATANSQPLSSIADPNPTNNPPPPEVAAQNLEDAPGKIMSTPTSAAAAPESAEASGPVADIAKLVRAGVSQDVLMAYVTNSAFAYNLSSDDIVYLKDIGTPDTVLTTIMQRDQSLKSNPPAATVQAPPPPVQPNPPVEATPNPEPQTAPLTPNASAEYAAAPNVSYTYFYDSLSPYGTWIDIAGYGPCWQPTVVVSNPYWQPYGDSGHWVYTDCGWCWMSDYSWGWAPFHYGRWFRHSRWGWCWAPDTVWGPSWVSWRYSEGYCGWAPLPPTACYRPGFGFTYYGRSVDFAFSFGISADLYCFVPLGHCYDPHPWRYRVPKHEVTKIYNNTTIINQYVVGDHNRIVNKGVPVDRVATAAHTEIKPVRIREHNEGPGAARFERNGKELAVYHPALPEPKPGRPSALVGEGVKPNPHFNSDNRSRRIPLSGDNARPQQPATGSTATEKGGHRQQPMTVPNVPTTPGQSRSDNATRHDNGSVRDNTSSRDNRTTVEPGEKPGSLIYHGPNRQKSSGNDVISQPTAPDNATHEDRAGRGIRRAEQAPSVPAAPVQRQTPTPPPIQTAPLTPENGQRQNRNEQGRYNQSESRGNSSVVTPAPHADFPSYQTPRQAEQPQRNFPAGNDRREENQQWQQRSVPQTAPLQPTQPVNPGYSTPREQPRWSDNSGSMRQQQAAPVAPRVYESRPSTPMQTVPNYSRGDSHRNYDNGNYGNGYGNARDHGNRGNQ